MRRIEMAGGYVALVDDEDYDRISAFRWCQARGYAQYSLYTKGTGKKGKRKTILMHRLIMDARVGQMIDHIDGDFLNNQKSNLRFCTPSQNQANARRRGKFKSNYKGVSPVGKKWQAAIRADGRIQYLGVHETQEAAAWAYAAAAVAQHGKYAYSEIIETEKTETEDE